MGGGGSYGYFRYQGLPVASTSVLKDFTDDASTISAGSFFPKRDSPNDESVLATAGTTLLLVEFIDLAA